MDNKKASAIIIDHETRGEEEETVQHSYEALSVWKFAERSDDKTFAICLICDKHIKTSNWPTTTIRHHLTQVHNKTEFTPPNNKKTMITAVNRNLKEKLHKLLITTIIKDNLPFNAFNKTGLSKLIQEAIPGNIKLLIQTIFNKS